MTMIVEQAISQHPYSKRKKQTPLDFSKNYITHRYTNQLHKLLFLIQSNMRNAFKILSSNVSRFVEASIFFLLFSVMASGHQLPILWNYRLQLPLQYDIHISILSNVRRRIVPRADCWFLFHVSIWRPTDDCILDISTEGIWWAVWWCYLLLVTTVVLPRWVSTRKK